MTYYIYAEDFVAALIGPFLTMDAAERHVEFCKKRGDAATMKILNIGVDTAAKMDVGLRMTAEEDREWTE